MAPPRPVGAALPKNLSSMIRGHDVPVRLRAPPSPAVVEFRNWSPLMVVVATLKPDSTRSGAPVPSKPAPTAVPTRVIWRGGRVNEHPVMRRLRDTVLPSGALSRTAWKMEQSSEGAAAAAGPAHTDHVNEADNNPTSKAALRRMASPPRGGADVTRR